MTITEALAEIKTIGKRIISKQESLRNYIARNDQMKDPMAKEGGSAKFVAESRQAIIDLQKRIIDLRTAIQFANMQTNLTIGEQQNTIFQWLTWRREVAPVAKKNADELWNVLTQVRQAAQSKGLKIVAAAAAVNNSDTANDVIINISETDLAKERENLETILGELDGRLSLVNATTQIDL